MKYTDMKIVDFMYGLFEGFSDHSAGTLLIRHTMRYLKNFYIEKHVRIGSGYFEDAWSVELDELEAVLHG